MNANNGGRCLSPGPGPGMATPPAEPPVDQHRRASPKGLGIGETLKEHRVFVHRLCHQITGPGAAAGARLF